MAPPIQPIYRSRLEARAPARGQGPESPAPGAARPRIARRVAARVVLATLLAAAAMARPAAAVEGLYLTWDDCPQGATHSSTRVFNCQDNTTSHELYCAFTMPQSTDQVIAMEVVVDIQHAAATMPNWWRMDPSGCRSGSISVAPDFPGKSACLQPWQG